MDPERWRRVTEIFHAALTRDSGRRAAFLAEACGDDAALHADVENLLAGDERARAGGDPFATPRPAVAPGMALGPYRIESALGAGGMGEVYKARDTRLNRSVAIKVLPSAFANEPELRQRFEREAQAIAALHHPNICILHDIGHRDGIEFLVMEYLEGETLEQRLRKGALPVDRALQHAIEIADALDSAHRAGITHRDLKPGNVMLTKGGAKLLDFGLAKFGVRAGAFASATALPTTPPALTEDGTIVGTFQYMAPEQLEGREADARTDLFAFGAIVYEMMTGRRAFTGESRSALIASILRDEPPPLLSTQPLAPPAADLVIRTCLAKDPDARLQSAHDVGQQLRWILDGAFQPAAVAAHRPSWRRTLALIATTALAAAVAAGMLAYSVGRRRAVPAQPTLRQLTFSRGSIDAARFTPDGQSVVYTAAWDGKPRQVFSMRVDTGESLPLPLPEGVVQAISGSGELALVIKNSTLARVPLGGGGVRELADQVVAADWLPDGSALAAVRRDRPGHFWLEFPLGTKVHEWSGEVTNIRISPDGSTAAVTETNTTGGGWLTFVDRTGEAKRVSGEFSGIGCGLVWTRAGDETWFTASNVGLNFFIHGMTRNGVQRVVHRSLGSECIQDLARDGRALVLHEWGRAGMVALPPGEQRERELSWFDFGTPNSLSADGRMVTFTESGAGVGPYPSAFVRRTDGSPAIRIATGTAGGISPDGTHLLLTDENRQALKVVPIGAGDIRRIDTGSPKTIAPWAVWTPDATRIVFAAREPGHAQRLFVVPAAGGAVRAVTPEGVGWNRGGLVVSSDSRYVLGRARDKVSRYPIDGGAPLALDGLLPDDVPLRWSADGRSIWVLGGERPPMQIFQLDVMTGRRTLSREIENVDPAGLVPDFLRVLVSADGKSYVYGYARTLSDLYVVDGVR